jgi:hypothetical protein
MRFFNVRPRANKICSAPALNHVYIGLESNHSPYSKSHARRQKRRAKEQIAGGLDDMQLALAAVEDETADAEAQDSMPAATDDSAPIAQPKKKAKPKPGQIGEGKGAPLSRSQRQRALYVCFNSHSASLPGLTTPLFCSQ